MGRLAKTTSLVLRKSSAARGEEMTMVGTWTRRRYMIGPYFWDKVWRPRWGRVVRLWRFPIIGSGRGPGGSFRPVLLGLQRRVRKKKQIDPKMRRRRVRIVGDMFWYRCGV